ncbi:MAG: phosphotransferase family protein [Vicinamibacteraceae bacterium]
MPPRSLAAVTELNTESARTYLRTRLGALPASLTVTAPGGGVSNVVLLVESEQERFILKQALAKLRVHDDWFSDRDRIFRESTALRRLNRLLPEGAIPRVLFEDRANYLFAMSAAPRGAPTWKDQLMAGHIDPETAAEVARLLGALMAGTWNRAEYRDAFGDQTVFDQLRIDPYYRTTVSRHPDLGDFFADLIRESGARRVAVVHGDWSPKNILVSGDRVMVIDFEVVHFGDPAFDAAFLLNHLLIKSVYLAHWRSELLGAALRFWTGLRASLPAEAAWFESATIRHLGALLLARVDGKSPVEYVEDEAMKQQLRGLARRLILEPPRSVAEVFA